MHRVLSYPGSKWNIARQIVELIPEHHSYVEPYFGSGAVFFNKKPSEIETINDLDDDVPNLFSCIRKDPERLAGMAAATPYSRKTYDSQFDGMNPEDPFERALGFLIKCWQGHGFRTNQYKVGWKNDVVGRESMYALRNWYRLPAWIMEIAERLRGCQIECAPALDVIRRFNNKQVCMYVDPPYLLNTRSGKQYKHEMNEQDHVELLEELVHSKAKILLSGYESELYDDYLSGWNKFSFNCTAEYGMKRTEVLWTNFGSPVRQLSIFDMQMNL